jgi:hypothetical protein
MWRYDLSDIGDIRNGSAANPEQCPLSMTCHGDEEALLAAESLAIQGLFKDRGGPSQVPLLELKAVDLIFYQPPSQKARP